MKHLLTIIVLLLALSACNVGRNGEMEALLDRADSMNRAYIPMTDGIDSLLLEATKYYDRHGTPNQQIRAHYLLGCAYRDMGEAPAALQSYQDAVDRADTLSSDCDYHRLMSVYGQMAELFDAQNLPDDELDVVEKYGRLALKEKDTLLYIRNLELLSKPYLLLGDTAKMLQSLEDAQQLYEARGLHSEAVRCYGLRIDIAIKHGKLDDVQWMMSIYEAESGLFNDIGEIAKGREIYYGVKGNYYLARHRLDSAEYYMRKLLSFSEFRYYGCRGLMNIYRYKGNNDSIIVYSQLFEKEIDSQNNQLRTDVIHQMSSLYNYQHFQREVSEKELALANTKIQRNGYALLAVITLCFLVLINTLYRNMRRKRNKALLDYGENLMLLNKTQFELSKLQQHESEYKDLIAEKRVMITKLKEKLESRPSPESLLKGSDIYKRFHKLSNAGIAPSSEEWDNLYAFFQQVIPNFCDFMSVHKHELNEKEYQTCLLIRIHIPPKAIGVMLGCSASYISRIRSKMSETLFAEGGKSTKFDKMICKIS